MCTHRIVILAISALLLLPLAGCERQAKSVTVSPGKIEITGLSDDKWTYWSFSETKVVGTSKLGSDEEDAQWAGRDDWDIAICGELLRTNGGASGAGEGGIMQNTTTDYYNLVEAPESGYLEDVDGIAVIR